MDGFSLPSIYPFFYFFCHQYTYYPKVIMNLHLFSIPELLHHWLWHDPNFYATTIYLPLYYPLSHPIFLSSFTSSLSHDQSFGSFSCVHIFIFLLFFISFLDMIFFNKPLKEKRIKASKTSHNFCFYLCYSIYLFFDNFFPFCLLIHQVIGGELQDRLIPIPYSKSTTDQAVREFNCPVKLLSLYLTLFLLDVYPNNLFQVVSCTYTHQSYYPKSLALLLSTLSLSIFSVILQTENKACSMF